MNTIQHSTQADGLNILLHLGAGQCRELDTYLAYNIRHIVLVEGDPELAETLREHTQEIPNVEVVSAVIAATVGKATFYRYSLRDANSLHAATGLLKIFPGLKKLDELSLDTTTPGTLLNSLGLKLGQENTLVVDIPGEEFSVLQALEQEGLLHIFNKIQLHCGREILYEGSHPASEILQWLRLLGYDVQEENDTQDPDRPTWNLLRNELYLENHSLHQEIAAIQQSKQVLMAEKDVVHKQMIDALNCEKQELFEGSKKLNDLLIEQQRQTEHWKNMVTELNREMQELVEGNKGLEDRLTEQQRQTEHWKNMVTELNREMQEFVEGNKGLEDRLTEQQRQTEYWKDMVTELNSTIAESEATKENLERQLSEKNYRQILMDEEMVKAEGQIDLIKDILIREKIF